jgi:hypothetical protein
MRRPLALSCALLALAAPGAWAQTGDEQYQDPFADEGTAQTTQEDDGGLSPTPQPSGGGSGSSGSGDQGSGSGSSGSGSGTSGSGSAGGGPDGAATPAAPAQSGRLPRTGADAWLVGLLGSGLLVTGVGLRLRTADDRF